MVSDNESSMSVECQLTVADLRINNNVLTQFLSLTTSHIRSLLYRTNLSYDSSH